MIDVSVQMVITLLSLLLLLFITFIQRYSLLSSRLTVHMSHVIPNISDLGSSNASASSNSDPSFSGLRYFRVYARVQLHNSSSRL